MKDNYIIKEPSLDTLLKEFLLEKDALAIDEEDEDLEYSVYRIEQTRERFGYKAKLVSNNELDSFRKKGFSIQEGYWIVNGVAHYIAISRS